MQDQHDAPLDVDRAQSRLVAAKGEFEVTDAFFEPLPDDGDPFDRALVSQAIAMGMTILTPDEAIRQYPVPTIW